MTTDLFIRSLPIVHAAVITIALLMSWRDVRNQHVLRPIWLIAAAQIIATFWYGWVLWSSLSIYFPDSHGQILWQPLYLTQLQYTLKVILFGWLTAAILGYLLILIFIRRLRGAFIDRDDILLIIIATSAVGWPSVFIFLGLCFVLSVSALILLVLLKKRHLTERLVITPYIIPAALLALLLQSWLLRTTSLWRLQF